MKYDNRTTQLSSGCRRPALGHQGYNAQSCNQCGLGGMERIQDPWGKTVGYTDAEQLRIQGKGGSMKSVAYRL